MTRLSRRWCVLFGLRLPFYFSSAVAAKATARIKQVSHHRAPREVAVRAEVDPVDEGLVHRASGKS